MAAEFKSSERFQATITSSGALFSPIDPRAEPIRLERIWNKSDELLLDIYPEDRLTKDSLAAEFLLIKRGDTVELIIESFVVFFGEVIETQNIRGEAKNRLRLTCVDQMRFLSEVQLDRAIFNGYRDRIGWDLSDELTNPLISGIKPIAAAQFWQPDGWLDISQLNPGNNRIFNVIYNDSGGNNIHIGWLFRPRSPTIERLFIPLNHLFTDPVAPDITENGTRFDRDIIFEFQSAIATGNADPDDIHPSGIVLTRRSGRDARYRMITKLREVWNGITAGVKSGSFSSSNSLTWVAAVDGTGSSAVRIIIPTPGTAPGFFASDRYCQLDYDGTGDAASVETVAPSVRTTGILGDHDVPPSGWLEIITSFLDNNDFTGAIEIYVGTTTQQQVAARIVFSGGNMSIEDNTGLTQFKTGIDLAVDVDNPGSYIHRFQFKIRPERLEFDFSYLDHLGSVPNFQQVLRNAEFIAKDTFADRPTRITKWRFEITAGSNAMRMNIGNVDGTEPSGGSALTRSSIFASFSVIDLTDDPIDVQPGEWIAVVGSTIAAADDDGVGIGASIRDAGLGGGQLATRRQTTRSTFSSDGGTTWAAAETVALDPVDYPILIEYSDSWVEAIEGTDFQVDYDNDLIDWGKGTKRLAPIKASVTQRQDVTPPFYTGISSGKLDTVRISEYENPSTKGLIQSLREMRLPDVVKHLVGFRATEIPTVIVDGNNDGVDDDPTAGGGAGEGYHTSDFEVDVYVIQQSMILDALRDLADEFKAIISVTPSASPTFIFERAKVIAGFDSFSPGAHEFTLSRSQDLFPEIDAQRLKAHNIGIAEGEVFTTFSVYGADVSIQAVKTNWDLVDELGGEKEAPPETFRKETDEIKLRRFAETLEDVFGIRLVEGEVKVTGYWPPSPPGPNQGQLDLNALVRIVDQDLPGGTGITAGDTENIFKVERIVFESESNQTTLFVSNRNLHRARLERLEEQRNLLNGIEPAKPEKDIRRRARNDSASLSASGVGTVYMALFVDAASGSIEEIATVGYRRAQTTLWIHDDGRLSFAGFFPEGIGSVRSDRFPIVEVRLYPFSGRTETYTQTGNANGTYNLIIDGIVHSFVASGHTIQQIRDGLFDEVTGAGIGPGVDEEVPVEIEKDGTDKIQFISIGHTSVSVGASGPSSNFTLEGNADPLAAFDFSAQRDVMYKWDTRTLHLTLTVQDSDQ